MHWSAGYVGIPFVQKGRDRAGVDCWGLVRLVYGERLGIDLPSYTEGYASLAERVEIAGLIDAERAAPDWRTVDGFRDFDVLLFRLGRIGAHVGLVAGRSRILHVVEGEQARIEDFTGPRLVTRLVAGYRHVRCS